MSVQTDAVNAVGYGIVALCFGYSGNYMSSTWLVDKTLNADLCFVPSKYVTFSANTTTGKLNITVGSVGAWQVTFIY